MSSKRKRKGSSAVTPNSGASPAQEDLPSDLEAADYSLDDDGDYFTWTLDELRAALSRDEAPIMELYYDVEAQGEMHHNPAKNVLWIARDPADIAKQLGLEESAVNASIAAAKAKMLAARLPRPTPFVDKTMYVSWNAMFVSAYLDAARVLEPRTGTPQLDLADVVIGHAFLLVVGGEHVADAALVVLK
jgi:uncharacterized protein YyaL (SSP411 family)